MMPKRACLRDKAEPPALAGGVLAVIFSLSVSVSAFVAEFAPPANAGGSACNLSNRVFDRAAHLAVISRLERVASWPASPGGHSSKAITISESSAAWISIEISGD